MNRPLLEYELATHKISKNELMNKLDLSRSALYRKMNGVTEFKREEMTKIIELLNLDEKKVMLIFFASKVS